MTEDEGKRPHIEVTPKLILGLLHAFQIDLDTDRNEIQFLKERINQLERRIESFQQSQRALVEGNRKMIQQEREKITQSRRTLIYLFVIFDFGVIITSSVIDLASNSLGLVGLVFLCQLILLIVLGIIAIKVAGSG